MNRLSDTFFRCLQTYINFPIDAEELCYLVKGGKSTGTMLWLKNEELGTARDKSLLFWVEQDCFTYNVNIINT